VPRRIPTGCTAIDKALEGGIPSENISLIYGEAETGKTTLAIQCALGSAKQGCKTLFVDCDGTFSAQRLSQVASEKLEKIGELLILMKPNNFQEQTNIVDRLADYVTSNLGLVVFDTITSLYRLKVAEFPKRTFTLNRELNRQLASLAQITKMCRVAVLLVSQVQATFREDSTNAEPVATRVLKFWADTIINVRPTENPQVVRAMLEKIPAKIQPAICHLRIGETGIHSI
jgi:DNA repair protein RadB